MSKRKWNFMNNSTRRVDMSLPIQVQSRLYHFKSHILALVAAHVLAWLWSPVFSASPVPPLTNTAIKPSRGVWHPLITRPVSTAPPNLHSFSHDRSRKVSPMYLTTTTFRLKFLWSCLRWQSPQHSCGPSGTASLPGRDANGAGRPRSQE